MKYKILIGFLTLMLLSSLALAAPSPQPVAGKVTLPGYTSLGGLSIEQKNLRTGIVYTTELDGSGHYLVDWGNYKYYNGDQIEISIKVCQDKDVCKKTVRLEGDPLMVNFDVPSSFEVIKETTTTYICSNGKQVSNKNDCPLVDQKTIIEKEIIEKEVLKDGIVKEVLKELTTTTYVCSDGLEVKDKEECDTTSDSWLYGLIAALAVVLGGLFGGGWKFYNGKFKHYHRGLNSYHDPNTKHNNPKYRHRSWKESAFGCIRDVKEIQKGIDLSK